MKISWPKSFIKAYHSLPRNIQSKFDEKIQLFEKYPDYPSLRVKKMSGTENIWEASITKNYRWTFEWREDWIKLRYIGTHDILRKE